MSIWAASAAAAGAGGASGSAAVGVTTASVASVEASAPFCSSANCLAAAAVEGRRAKQASSMKQIDRAARPLKYGPAPLLAALCDK
jgi:hypothetical protein